MQTFISSSDIYFTAVCFERATGSYSGIGFTDISM